LIPQNPNPPMDYTSTAKAQEIACITRKEMISHFARAQKMNQSGIVDKYYNLWANRVGINSTQCRRLAEFFSQAVDAPKTGQQIRIPAELKIQKNDEDDKNEFIWMKMLKNAKKFKEEFETKLINENQLNYLSKETLLNILFERRCPNNFNYHNTQSFSEYQLIISILKWANQDEDLEDFIYLFDFSQLTIEQKQDIELSLKINREYLYSILKKSRILSNEIIDKYHLSETCLSWRLFYVSPKLFRLQSQIEFQQTFQPIIYVLNQNSQHERTLINISIDDTMTLVLDIHRNAILPTDTAALYQIQTGLFNAYLESKLYSIRRKFLLDTEYFINMNDDRIQIYQTNPRNSFIVFMYDVQNEKKVISVDLTRFDRNILRTRNHPKVNRHEFTYFEIFVLSPDQQISSSYYPVISYFDEEYFTQNYFHQQIENYQYVEYLTEQ